MFSTSVRRAGAQQPVTRADAHRAALAAGSRVALATLTAGRQIKLAATDSLTSMSSVLAVQTLMGIAADRAAIVLVDSLRLSPAETDAMLRTVDSVTALLVPPSRVAGPFAPAT